jgi:hypothetical protein
MRKENQCANDSRDPLDLLVHQRDAYQLIAQRQERLESKLDAMRALLSELLTSVTRGIEEVAIKVDQHRESFDELKALLRRDIGRKIGQQLPQ